MRLRAELLPRTFVSALATDHDVAFPFCWIHREERRLLPVNKIPALAARTLQLARVARGWRKQRKIPFV